MGMRRTWRMDHWIFCQLKVNQEKQVKLNCRLLAPWNIFINNLFSLSLLRFAVSNAIWPISMLIFFECWCPITSIIHYWMHMCSKFIIAATHSNGRKERKFWLEGSLPLRQFAVRNNLNRNDWHGCIGEWMNWKIKSSFYISRQSSSIESAILLIYALAKASERINANAELQQKWHL